MEVVHIISFPVVASFNMSRSGVLSKNAATIAATLRGRVQPRPIEYGRGRSQNSVFNISPFKKGLTLSYVILAITLSCFLTSPSSGKLRKKKTNFSTSKVKFIQKQKNVNMLSNQRRMKNKWGPGLKYSRVLFTQKVPKYLRNLSEE